MVDLIIALLGIANLGSRPLNNLLTNAGDLRHREDRTHLVQNWVQG